MSESRRTSPLRVVLVIGTLDRGGTEGQVVALAARLRQRGHLVRIVCMDKAGDLREDAIAAGVDVVEAGFAGITRRSPRALLRMYRGIREPRPDVVHCFLYLANLLGVPLGRVARARVVLMSERSLQHAIRSRWFLRPLLWLSHRLSDGIVCNSQAVLEDIVRKAALARRKSVLIPNGVAFTDPVSDPPSSAPVVVLAIANLIAYKGLDVLLDAFAQVLRRFGGHVVQLRLLGAGPEEGRLRAQAARLGIDGAVEFLGSVAHVGPFLERCSFTVLPSYTEGMPNAVLESLAAGRAVIATCVGGTAEILVRGGGILVPPGDPDRLAGAMCELIADPSRARDLGEQGWAIVRDNFSMDQMVDATLSLYTGLLVSRPQRGRRARA